MSFTNEEQIAIMGASPIAEQIEMLEEYANNEEDEEEDEVVVYGIDGRFSSWLRRLFKNKKGKIVKRKKQTHKFSAQGSSPKRQNAIHKIANLPKKTRRAIVKGKKQLSDKILFSVEIAGNSSKLVRTDNGTSEGVTNISNGKNDNNFLLQEIKISYEPSIGTNAPKKSNWDAKLPPEITNGNLTISVDSKIILSELELNVLPNYGNEQRALNTFVLDNSKWFYAKKDIQSN